MLTRYPYDRAAVVAYAHEWAFERNPRYLNFDSLGGDCTNFASQCLFAGAPVMNYTPTFGWYYLSSGNRTPSWTGVLYFYNFLMRNETSPGPVAAETALDDCEPGDFVQLAFGGGRYAHTPVIVSIEHPATPETTLVAAHTYDADYRPLSTYENVSAVRHLHIAGYYQ